jgi:GT2 family glycosyltransferase
MSSIPYTDVAHPDELISVSIVVFKPRLPLLRHTLRTLDSALTRMRVGQESPLGPLYLVNNDLSGSVDWPGISDQSVLRQLVIEGHGNVGYGRGHNLAIERTTSRYHLILNPDIELDDNALARAIAFLDKHPEVGVITPHIRGDDGEQQFLCRRFPTVLDLFVRGFLPRRFRTPFAERLARYELRDAIDDKNVFWDPPIVSGCFMLYRTEVLKKLGGFDPRYFLYFEDYDLSLRTHDIARIAYVPSVRVLHHGGDAARKGFTHIKLFITSAIRFFNRFGWRWL